MKEIWIEKLIELLNEYAKVLRIWDYVWWHNKETVENSDYIFTKKFWFIWWLVKNNKVDISKVWKLSNMWFGDKYTREETLLMLLSIQDEPINFLISILK